MRPKTKKKTNKSQVNVFNKEKYQANHVVQEGNEINSSSWLDLFNNMQISSFAKNYFGNLSFNKFNNQKILLCGSKDELDIP